MKKTILAMLITSFTTNYTFSIESDNYIFEYSSTKGLFKPLDLTSQFTNHNTLNLENGSITFRFKNGSDFGTFLGVADPDSSTKYLSFYSYVNNPIGKDTYGIEIRNGGSEVIRTNVPTSSNEYRNITYTFDKTNNKVEMYIDGEKLLSNNNSNFFTDIPNISNAFLGETRRSTVGGFNTMRFNGDIFYADFDKNVLTPEEVAEKHKYLTEFQSYSLGKKQYFNTYKTTATPLFISGQNGANNYRIPSLFTTKDNVVIAAIDKRHQHPNDWGNIDTVIRRSLDGGKTWEDDQVLIDLISQPYGNQNSAFLIDPQIVQDKNTGRIFMIVDMFPEMRGLFGLTTNSEGTGYKNIDGKNYRLLTDANNNQYTVRDDGIVYDESNQPTDYKVVVEGDISKSYQDLGDLYRGDNKVGNIFLNTQNEGNQSAPLMAKITSYLWMIHSDDNGKTWSSPVDITPQVKADWMQFLGTGPGNGIQLKNGNLVVPVYYTNNVGGLNSQSPAVIISNDGGKTWTRGESPIDRWEYQNGGTRELNTRNKQMTESQVIELDNGDLKMFSRNLMDNYVVISTSKDGGYTWQNTRQIDDVLLEPYSQLSVIKYSKKIDGKEIVIFANPHASNRSNGKVWLGEVQDDGTIEWKFNTTITTGSYAYNSLTELPNGDIGLLYEESASSINYVRLNLQELVWHDNLIYRDIRADNEDKKEFSLDSNIAETFYKIGDGEMVKVGKGENLANLVVKEGTATLNQQADNNGKLSAFNSVTVEQDGKVRLGSPDQVNLSNINLNNGTLDLNGNSITLSLDSEAATGLRSSDILGNIINEDNTKPSELTYTLNGENSLTGNLGSESGNLDFIYTPEDHSSNFTLNGNSILNVVDIKSGSITYASNTEHLINDLQIAKDANFILDSGTNTTIKSSDVTGKIRVQSDSNSLTQLNINSSGTGELIKSGDGLLKLTGALSHSGQTHIQSGAVELNGSLSNGALLIDENSILGGNAIITSESTWKNNSVIQPGIAQNEGNFGSRVMKFANVLNGGANLLLRVNNANEDISTWEHDQVLINGDVVSRKAIPVNVQFLGEGQSNSDTNNNGKYDPDEGISLIQVLGDSTAEQFVLGKRLNSNKDETDLFQYTLVGVDKSVSNTAQSKLDDPNARFFDYRLQTLLVNENGENPDPIIKVATDTGSSISTEDKPTLSTEDALNLAGQEYRVAINQKVPSYLVANNAILNQGDTIRRQFMDNIWSINKKGFYINQQNGNSRYTSDVSFNNYGYGYKATQSSTLIGGFTPITENMELHAGIGFSKQDVTPRSPDGYSETRYKSTSFLAGLHNRWNNIILNSHIGYHIHHGKVSTAEQRNIASINAKQFQIGSEVGYAIPLNDITITPTIGINYQRIKTKVNDHSNDWNISMKPYNVFSQYMGANVGWKNEIVALNLGAFYENSNLDRKDVLISDGRQHSDFMTGKQGDAFLMKIDSEFTITEQLSLGLKVEHRHDISDAKLKQTQFGGRLEYKF
ncbi:exo-alpha-sialidase [Otariodibacter oris]|uniref:exo-alpha-sialidase n=1 Tax=Otariodibacter oris TaxID=1032623 RepID=A0A420XFX9_9PAST|nr:exo-alpha-sialidase [Otariodibacter oris]QGM80352.1 hypothetical protein A6A10_02535 [Otariodibacter oris]RKR71722.1 autotransporter-associated beta strand protein [Otariodibacter oris]